MSEPAVIAYYTDRTDHILRKYGPEPWVHFHTGLVDGPVAPDDEAALHALVREAQRALLCDAADAWDAASRLSGRVLDVGCGLGGGALYWADAFGARVGALTDVPRHAALVREFASRTGLANRVEVLVQDACALDGPPRFDAAVAIESACYLDPDAWFACLDRVLHPTGRVHVVDCFTARPDVARSFDAYWHTRIGGFSAFERAGARRGFRLLERTQLNDRVVGFWDLSIRRTRIELEHVTDPNERKRLARSLEEHRALQQHLATGAIQYLRVTFERA